MAVPDSTVGYYDLRQVHYTHTQFQHSSPIYIDVYFPASTTNAVYITERNYYEKAQGYNDRYIQNGGIVSPYKRDEVIFTDGSKIVRYEIPDLSPYHKRVVVTTCPNTTIPTQVECERAAVDIIGFVDY